MNLTQITKNVLLCLLALAALVQARGLVSTYNGFFKRMRVAPANLLTPHAELACADCGAPQWDALRSRLARGLPDDGAIVFVPGVEAVAGVGSTTEKAYVTLCYALFPRRVELALPDADTLTPERLIALGARHNARYAVLYRPGQTALSDGCQLGAELRLVDLRHELRCDDGVR
ncbi:MAG: hypothetical protein U0X75_29995 [Acidobacteriota bacterium]